MSTSPEPPASLTLLTKEEWWDVARRLNSGLDWETFERQWAEFNRMNDHYQRMKRLH